MDGKNGRKEEHKYHEVKKIHKKIFNPSQCIVGLTIFHQTLCDISHIQSECRKYVENM